MAKVIDRATVKAKLAKLKVKSAQEEAKKSYGKKPRRITEKQILFAHEYVKNGRVATEAYKKVFNTKANSDTIKREGHLVLNHPNVAALVEELTANIMEHRGKSLRKSLDDQIEDCEVAMAIAQKMGQAGGYVSAVRLRSELMGLIKRKVEVTKKVETMTADEIKSERKRLGLMLSEIDTKTPVPPRPSPPTRVH